MKEKEGCVDEKWCRGSAEGWLNCLSCLCLTLPTFRSELERMLTVHILDKNVIF